MRIWVFLLVNFVFITTLAQYFEIDTLKLNNSYISLMERPYDKQAQETFFEAFPGSWPEFISTYAYSESPGYDLTMYKQYSNHCDAFISKLNEIDSVLYCKKIVELAIGARIDFDAPNALRQMQHIALQTRRNDMLSTIRSLSTSDQVLYWQFFWSSTLYNIKDQEEFNDLYKYMKKEGLLVEAKIMKRAFDNFHGKSTTIKSKHVGQRQYEGKDY